MKRHFDEYVDNLIKEFEDEQCFNNISFSRFINYRVSKNEYRLELEKIAKEYDNRIDYIVTDVYFDYKDRVIGEHDSIENITKKYIKEAHEKMKYETNLYERMYCCYEN
jgi:hypothetical protein